MAKLVGAVKKDLDALISGIKDDIDKADTLLANFMAASVASAPEF